MPMPFYSGEVASRTHLREGCVNSAACMDVVRRAKSLKVVRFERRIVDPVAVAQSVC
jgi:hypothetical protein